MQFSLFQILNLIHFFTYQIVHFFQFNFFHYETAWVDITIFFLKRVNLLIFMGW